MKGVIKVTVKYSILKFKESLKVKDPIIREKPKNMKNKHPLYKIGLLFLRPR